jgi:hypothetical protein
MLGRLLFPFFQQVERQGPLVCYNKVHSIVLSTPFVLFQLGTLNFITDKISNFSWRISSDIIFLGWPHCVKLVC